VNLSGDSAPQRVAIGAREDLFLLRGFLSPAECRGFIALSEDHGYEAAMIATARGQVLARDIRDNDRLIWDDPALADDWWRRVQPFLTTAVGRWRPSGLNERFRYYRYRVGQRFAQHRDGSYERSATEMSWMTLLVYLNDGFEGGATRFDLAGMPEAVRVVPEAGMALLFLHDRLHEGEPVRQGVKYVLRTDVMFRRD